MTSRLPGFGRQASRGVGGSGSQAESTSKDAAPKRDGLGFDTDGQPVNLDRPVELTSGMVDEAVAEVKRNMGLTPEVAETLQFLMGVDATQGVAQSYFVSWAAARRRVLGPSRIEMTISYALQDEQVKMLTDYAPDVKISFRNSENHDHPMAAACRKIDHVLIMARLPVGHNISDIGGNPLVHITAGRSNVHVCGPVADVKDPMRHTLRDMRARKMVQVDRNKSVRDAALRYLERDRSSVCVMKAQDCTYPADILTAVHVYDIPLQDWPGIMRSKGAALVEGCMLFSDKFFVERSGTMGVANARYEIDFSSDTFSMGFVDSPSMWYSHKWSEYMLYGVDQVLVGNGERYSYSIVERRGDTIFFRILKMGEVADPGDMHVTLKTPGVPVVRVHGFKLGRDRGGLQGRLEPEVYQFPQSCWYEMVSQAAEQFERGTLDFNSMYNFYRTVTVRQTINAVLIMGGDRVTESEVVPLVVHSVLAAVAQCLLGQRETRALTEVQMKHRRLQSASNGRMFVDILSRFGKNVLQLPLAPFMALGRYITAKAAVALDAWVMDWEPVVENALIPVSELDCVMPKAVYTPSPRELYNSSARRHAVIDHVAAVVSDERLNSLLRGLCPQADVPAPTAAGVASAYAPAASTAAPTYHTGVDAEAQRASRQASILEHIAQINAENEATEDVCRRDYSMMCVKGQPMTAMLRKKSEVCKNPDLWEVTRGVITKSALGLISDDFEHMAVYTPLPDPDTGSCIRAVQKVRWQGFNADNQLEEHWNRVIADSDFTGWVYVNDNLRLHNGPEIVDAMKLALGAPLDHMISVNLGPPGCGKTYSIIQRFEPLRGDVILCPGRESIDDTRKRVLEKHGPIKGNSKARCYSLDGFLRNYRSNSELKQLAAEVVLFDEALLTHPGKLNAAVTLLGAKRVEAYGDEKQIPFNPRAEAVNLHSKIVADAKSETWLTRRCPPTAVAAWGGQFDWRVRSTSLVQDAPMDMVQSDRVLDLPDDCVMLCMYQADKLTLRTKFSGASKRIRIMTVHESQGKTFKHVRLYRFDNRRRADKFSLFDQEPYVLVALSRHTHSFYYVCPSDLGDVASQWVARAKNVRAVAAAGDIESAGASIQFA